MNASVLGLTLAESIFIVRRVSGLHRQDTLHWCDTGPGVLADNMFHEKTKPVPVREHGHRSEEVSARFLVLSPSSWRVDVWPVLFSDVLLDHFWRKLLRSEVLWNKQGKLSRQAFCALCLSRACLQPLLFSGHNCKGTTNRHYRFLFYARMLESLLIDHSSRRFDYVVWMASKHLSNWYSLKSLFFVFCQVNTNLLHRAHGVIDWRYHCNASFESVQWFTQPGP